MIVHLFQAGIPPPARFRLVELVGKGEYFREVNILGLGEGERDGVVGGVEVVEVSVEGTCLCFKVVLGLIMHEL
jgi:hypothetical protein